MGRPLPPLGPRRPRPQPGKLEQRSGLVHFVEHFDSPEAADAWRASPEHERLAGEADAFTKGRLELRHGEAVDLKLPSETVVPRWKLAVATWTAVFPLLLLLNTGVRALPVRLPQQVQLAITSLIMVASLTWFILPQVKKLLRPWLFDDGEGGLRRDPD